MLKGLLAISGQSGLFKMVTESKNSIIVESLDTKKRMPVYSTSKVSALEDIAIYTQSGDIPLKDVFKSINEKQEEAEAPSHKSSSAELKSFFEEILPDYDKDRVYVSDIKKVLLWYNILHEKQLLDFSEEEQDDSKTDKTESDSE